MRAYYYDNLPGDQRLDHDSGRPVDLDHIRKLGILLWHVPLDNSVVWEAEVDKICEEQGCKRHDLMDITKEGLGDQFDTMLEKYFGE
jgi:1,2-dihydroxy-3-keto-5-methylthiopentene dioxygenase